VIDFDVFKLTGAKSGAYKWIYKFAKCSEELYTLGVQRSEFVNSPGECAVACQMELGSAIFSWNEYHDPWIKNHINDRCFCFQENIKSCTVAERCCKNSDCTELAGGNEEAASRKCEIHKKTQSHIGIILDTMESLISKLACPAVNTFMTSSMPAVGEHQVESVKICFVLCTMEEECSYISFVKKTNTCFLLGGVITSIVEKKGWISGDKKCAGKVGKISDALFWDPHVFV